jgi:hypothetical protein
MKGTDAEQFGAPEKKRIEKDFETQRSSRRAALHGAAPIPALGLESSDGIQPRRSLEKTKRIS